MNQSTFNFESLSRRSDPRSSKRAAAKMITSGALRGQALITFEALKRFPGRSTKEISKETGLDRYMLARRASDLWKAGQALKVEIGSQDCKWYAILR